MDDLDASFFRRAPVVCAQELIGAVFRWRGCTGRIVETEAYAAAGDPACHTFFRPGARLFVENHAAGTAYVYLNYGVHWLFNVLVKGPEGAGFVLFRALEPVEGISRMAKRRGRTGPWLLCSGPGRLTQALGIDGSAHGQIFLGRARTGILGGSAAGVAAGRRIGLSRGQDLPWRFYEPGNPHVSQ